MATQVTSTVDNASIKGAGAQAVLKLLPDFSTHYLGPPAYGMVPPTVDLVHTNELKTIMYRLQANCMYRTPLRDSIENRIT